MAIPHVHPSARLHLHLSVAPVPRLSPLRNAAGQLPLSTGGLSVGGQHMPSRVRPPVCLLCMQLCFHSGVSPLLCPAPAPGSFLRFRPLSLFARTVPFRFSLTRNANSSPHLLPSFPAPKLRRETEAFSSLSPPPPSTATCREMQTPFLVPSTPHPKPKA